MQTSTRRAEDVDDDGKYDSDSPESVVRDIENHVFVFRCREFILGGGQA